MTVQDRPPVVSQQSPGNEKRASLPSKDAGPDLLFCPVGVAGFEPTTSSSRSNDHRCRTSRDVGLDLQPKVRQRPPTYAGAHTGCHSVWHAGMPDDVPAWARVVAADE
jgi:hypothetical protein